MAGEAMKAAPRTKPAQKGVKALLMRYVICSRDTVFLQIDDVV